MKYIVYRTGRCGRIPTTQKYTRKGYVYDIFTEACESQWGDVVESVKIYDANGKLVVEA